MPSLDRTAVCIPQVLRYTLHSGLLRTTVLGNL
jgi:hypothetical protein